MLMKDISPKKRFALMLVAVYIISLPLISVLTYIILKQNAVRSAYSMGRLRLATMEAVKHYVAEELRPLLYRELPGRFIVEGMSRSYVAGEIARRVQKEYPSYTYKNASLSPMNPRDAADAFESGIINAFLRDGALKEWDGFRTRPDGRYYVIAKAGDPFTESCLLCHGDPADAPEELRKKYGTARGFHMSVGQLVDAKFVYIPIDVPLAEARKIVAIFIGIYTILFGAMLIIINIRFAKLFDQTESDKKRIEEINLELMNLNHDMESMISERTMNLIALSVADRIRNPAAAIAGTFNRILKKEVVSEPLKERMTDLLIEAQKLDSIVRDYETVLKSRQTMFRVEDLNEILRSVLPLIEKERKGKGVSLSLHLAESRARCMANRQLLRVAILHVIKNAVEATPPGGVLTISTVVDEDHIRLVVADSGKGIPAEDIPKIFSLFYSTKKHRIGMGLPLVKQIVDEHKGDIRVESESGKGTSFSLVFPVRWSEQELEGKERQY
jgi:signal transduction histidine kinase